MRRIHIFSKVLIVFASLIVLTLAIRVTWTIYTNRVNSANYRPDSSPSQYARNIPLCDMDFTKYIACFPSGIVLLDHNYVKTVQTPINLRYYSAPSIHASVVLELPRGTELIAIPTDEIYQFWTTGYGYLAYPTYSSGWHYAKPFLRVGQSGDYKALPSYFVQTSDLEAIARTVIDDNKAFQAAAQQKRWTRQKYAAEMVRFIDRLLYKNGVYSSPDLELPVFDLWDALLAGFLVIAGVAFLLLTSRRRFAWTLSNMVELLFLARTN